MRGWCTTLKWILGVLIHDFDSQTTMSPAGCYVWTRSFCFFFYFLAYISSIYCQQAELESLKGEYANAQLECSAADERAKLLASEVIGLEEKVNDWQIYVLLLNVKLLASGAGICLCIL